MNRLKNIPYGVQDYLPLEYFHKTKLEKCVTDMFQNEGYEMIETPVLEFMDVFCTENGGYAQEDMFKLSDNRGSLLVLRPDITMPIARMAATSLADKKDLRLCYCGNVFHLNGEKFEGYKQVTQVGIELMGDESYIADAEALILAIKSLKEAGLKEFKVEIGQTKFFNGLVKDAGLSDKDCELLRSYVESKDMLSMEMLLQKLQIVGSTKNSIMELPMLYGGTEILEEARKYCDNDICKKAVNNIEKVLEIIDSEGLIEYVSIDLSIVQSVHYYTGIVFQGICANLGYPLLTGGRYDDLVKNYGKDMPAVGFAITSKHMLIALEREGAL